MSIYKSVAKYIREKQLLSPSASILVAISGGADSVALAHVLLHLGFKVHLGHVNFQMRGKESETDEAFVRQMAASLQLSFFHTRITLEKNNSDSSMQLKARDARYRWLESVRKQKGLEAIATAHHANDQLETVLHRFIHRSTGIAGITGIPPKRQHIVRPFLSLRREEIIQFLRKKEIPWRSDRTNKHNHYDRNWIRNELIPTLRNRFPQWEKNALTQLGISEESQLIYQQFFERYVSKKIISDNSEYRFPILWIKKSGYAKSILWHYIGKCGFKAAQLEDIVRLLEAQNGKWVASSSHQMYKHQKWLFLSPLASSTQHTPKLIKECGITKTPNGSLSIKKLVANSAYAKKKNKTLLVHVAAKRIKFPLRLRPWQAGDYYYPLGMGKKKKKVARTLIDGKYSKAQKERVWVVESETKIVWVIGLRIDERFQLQEEASEAYQLEWKHSAVK